MWKVTAYGKTQINFLANPKNRYRYNAERYEVLCNSIWGKSDRDFPLSSTISFFLPLFLNAGDIRDTGSIPGLGRSPEERHVNSNIFAWRIPMDRGPGGQQSIGLQRARHGWSDWALTALSQSIHLYRDFFHSQKSQQTSLRIYFLAIILFFLPSWNQVF